LNPAGKVSTRRASAPAAEVRAGKTRVAKPICITGRAFCIHGSTPFGAMRARAATLGNNRVSSSIADVRCAQACVA
jgi:hypothetical protein